MQAAEAKEYGLRLHGQVPSRRRSSGALCPPREICARKKENNPSCRFQGCRKAVPELLASRGSKLKENTKTAIPNPAAPTEVQLQSQTHATTNVDVISTL